MIEDGVVSSGYIKELLKKMTKDVEKESIILPSHNDLSSLRVTKTEVDEREKQILNYIGDNPGVTKEEVIKAFRNESGTGYSRKPVLRMINNLEKNGMITVRNYGHSHRLYINREEILVSLNHVLVYFKKIYFNLIDKVTLPNRQIDTSFSNIYELVKGLVIIYKTFKNYFTNFFLWYGESNDGETLQRKFVIIYDAIQEIKNRLYQTLKDFDFAYSEMHLLIDNDSSEGLRPKNLAFIMSTFENYNLRKYAEPIIDLLWILFYKKLPLLHFEYHPLSRGGKLKNWRALVNEEIKNSSHKRKLLYCPPSN